MRDLALLCRVVKVAVHTWVERYQCYIDCPRWWRFVSLFPVSLSFVLLKLALQIIRLILMWLQKDWKCSPAYVMGPAHRRSNSRLDTPSRFSIEHSSTRWKAKTCFVFGIKLTDSICLPAWPFAVIEWPNAFWVLLSYISSRSCCSPSIKYLSPVLLWSLRPKLVANPVSTPLLIMYSPLRMSRIADMLPLVCIKMHASSMMFEPFGTPVWDRCQEQICRVPSREHHRPSRSHTASSLHDLSLDPIF